MSRNDPQPPGRPELPGGTTVQRTVLIVGVTGIAGFNTARAMSAAGWRVLGLSRSHRYDIPGVEQLRGDVLDPESLVPSQHGPELSHLVLNSR